MKQPTAEEIDQAAQMCVNAAHHGRSLDASLASLIIVRNWDQKVRRQVEKAAKQLLIKTSKRKKIDR